MTTPLRPSGRLMPSRSGSQDAGSHIGEDMLGTTSISARRTTSRLVHILRVLAKHGFLSALRGRGHWPAPAEVRAAFEELGVVFLKFGQLLALRRDLLPDAYIQELELLHDQLPPMAPSDVLATIERALGAQPHELFAEFDEVPLAAATIAQVHVARLAGGRLVVVKVRRVGLAERITEDIAVLTYLAALAEQRAASLHSLDLVGMVREFRESLGREMNLRLEGQTIRRFRAALAGVETVWIPDVVPERTTGAVLTLEHSPGERVDRYAERHPEAKRSLARQIATLVLYQVFETGLFHADPHPGNVFVLPDGRICLHDFGMIGEFDERMREGLTTMLEAAVRGDVRALTDMYLDLGVVGADIDRPALEADIGALLRMVRERPLAEISIGEVMQSLMRVGAQHRVRNPGALLLLARAFLITEALMRQLDPGMDVLDVFRTEVARVELRRYSPARLLAATRETAREIERVLRDTPGDLRRALRRAADGELGRVQMPGLEVIGRRASRDLERLTGAVASAAFIVAGALLVTVGGWHAVAGDVLLAIGIVGTLAVGLGALLRPRRPQR